MIPHTVAINEAKSKLINELIGDTQTDPRPIIVTLEDTGTTKGRTIAMLLPPSLFEDFPESEPDLYEFQLLCVTQELDTVERYWHDRRVQQAFVQRFPKLTAKLWKSCPEPLKRVCLSLDLAAKHLFADGLTLEKIGALRHFVDLISQGVTNPTEIRAAKNRLSAVGLPPIMGGSQELVDLYVEEL
jgi:hypothetical protein